MAVGAAAVCEFVPEEKAPDREEVEVKVGGGVMYGGVHVAIISLIPGPSVGGGGKRVAWSVVSQIRCHAGWITSPNSNVRVLGPEFARSGILTTMMLAGGPPEGKFAKHARSVGRAMPSTAPSVIV